MEADSKKRGRPRKFTEEEAAALRRHFPNVSERQRQNLFYAANAAQVLRGLIRNHTAGDSDEGRAFIEKHEWILRRQSILAELGRTLGKDWSPDGFQAIKPLLLYVDAVHWLGEHKPGTKRAVAVLRRHRRGMVRSASETDLAEMIARTIINYREIHPDVDSETVLRALDAVRSRLLKISGS